MWLKSLIKKFTPNFALSLYHLSLSWLACLIYGNPSRKMIIVGITGTKGKSSVANFIWSCLMANGYKTGVLSTASIKIGEEERLNDFHMTMPGRFNLQKLLREMYGAGCKFAIVETTSEGIKQWRHIGINYDIAIFTNLYREHLASHNNDFNEYRGTKGRLFLTLKQGWNKYKNFKGKILPKTIIANSDDLNSPYFLSFPTDKKITYSIKGQSNFRASNITSTENGSGFSVNEDRYEINLPGLFNIENALPAIALSESLGLDTKKTREGLSSLKVIPGRMEKIEVGQTFKVYVDYAHQKESLEALLKTAQKMVAKSQGKIILLLGAEGGGRDKEKRWLMGKLAGQLADYIIVSNVDPYDDDPKEIIEDIAKAVEKEGKIRGRDLFTIEDRRSGIKKAISLADKSDIVLITGKGSEQSIIIKGKRLSWDDRIVVREEITKCLRL